MLTFLYVNPEEGQEEGEEDKGEGTAERKEEVQGRVEAPSLPFIREEALSSAELDEPVLACRDTVPVPIPLDKRCSPQLQRQSSSHTSSALSKLMLINSTYQRLCMASASSGGGGNSVRGRSVADSPQGSRHNSVGQVEGLAIGNGSVSAIDFQSAGGSGCFLAEDLVAAPRAPNTPVTTTTGPDLDLLSALLWTPQQAGLARSAPDAKSRPLIAAALAAAAAWRSGFGNAPSPGIPQQQPLLRPPGGIIRAPPASTTTGSGTLLQPPGGSSASTSAVTCACSLSRMSGNSTLPTPPTAAASAGEVSSGLPISSGLPTPPIQLPTQQLTFPGFGRLSSTATAIETSAGGLQKRKSQEWSVSVGVPPMLPLISALVCTCAKLCGLRLSLLDSGWIHCLHLLSMF